MRTTWTGVPKELRDAATPLLQEQRAGLRTREGDGMSDTNRIASTWDAIDEGPLAEPWTTVGEHKVYRKESCTLDHRPVPARRYFGLWQCSACYGIIAPSLRRLRRLRLGAFTASAAHTNGRAA